MDPEAYVEMASVETTCWWFAARREILDGVIGCIALSEAARILRTGSGTGGNLMMLSRRGGVSAIEMDEVACAIAR